MFLAHERRVDEPWCLIQLDGGSFVAGSHGGGPSEPTGARQIALHWQPAVLVPALGGCDGSDTNDRSFVTDLDLCGTRDSVRPAGARRAPPEPPT